MHSVLNFLFGSSSSDTTKAFYAIIYGLLLGALIFLDRIDRWLHTERQLLCARKLPQSSGLVLWDLFSDYVVLVEVLYIWTEPITVSHLSASECFFLLFFVWFQWGELVFERRSLRTRERKATLAAAPAATTEDNHGAEADNGFHAGGMGQGQRAAQCVKSAVVKGKVPPEPEDRRARRRNKLNAAKRARSLKHSASDDDIPALALA